MGRGAWTPWRGMSGGRERQKVASGESHAQMNVVEQGSCSSGSSLQSSMAGIASESTKILIHTLSKWCDQVHCCKLVIRSPLQLLDFLVLSKLQMYLKNKLRMNLLPILQYYYSNTNGLQKRRATTAQVHNQVLWNIYDTFSFLLCQCLWRGGRGVHKILQKDVLRRIQFSEKILHKLFSLIFI